MVNPHGSAEQQNPSELQIVKLILGFHFYSVLGIAGGHQLFLQTSTVIFASRGIGKEGSNNDKAGTMQLMHLPFQAEYHNGIHEGSTHSIERQHIVFI